MAWSHIEERREKRDTTSTAVESSGKEEQGRPKQTWRRTVEGEMKHANLTWGTMASAAENRVRWKRTVSAICAAGVFILSRRLSETFYHKEISCQHWETSCHRLPASGKVLPLPAQRNNLPAPGNVLPVS